MYGISAQPRSSTSTTLAIDGVPLNNGMFPEASLNMLPLSLVQRIEVIQGPASSAYGNNSRLGVINLVTLRPAEFGGLAFASAGRWNTTDFGAHVGGALEGGGRYLAGYDRRNTDGHLQPRGRRDFSDSQLQNFAAFADKVFGDLTLSAAFVRYEWERDNPSYLVSPGVPAAANPTGSPTARYEDGNRQHAHLGASYQFAPQWHGDLTYTYNDYDEQTRFNPNFAAPTGNNGPTDQATVSHGLIGKLNWETSSNLLTFGAEYQNAKLTDRIGSTTTTGHTTGLFVQDRYLAFDGQLALSAGYRVDHFSFYDETSKSPKAGFVWKPAGATWLVRGNVARAFSAPTFNQLFGSFGNPRLVASTFTLHELGTEWQATRGLRLGASIFFTKSTKPIFPRPRNQNPICAPGPGNCFVNVGDVTRSDGVVLDFRHRINANWEWGGSYTYLDPKQNTFATSGHVIKLDSTWRSGPWTLSGTLRRETQRYFQDNHLSPFPNFTVIDAALSYQVTAAWKLSALIENLTDRTYATTQVVSTNLAIPALPIYRPERYVTARVDFRF
jgi:outer membrane receptor protein involved in Fe transport